MPSLTELDVEWVSLVDRAAVRDHTAPDEAMRFLVLKRDASAGRNPAAVPIAKSADVLVLKAEKQIVTGVVLQPGLTDSQGDVVSAKEIQRAAHRYIVASRKSDVQHNGQQAPVEVVESYIAPLDMTIGGKAVLKGAWVMAVRITDSALWGRITKGDLTGFSIGGTAIRKAEHHESTEETRMADQALQDKITRLEAENGDLKRQLETANVQKSSYSYDTIVERATELQKRDHTLSLGDAQTAVLKADRELSARYLDESRRGVASRPVAPPPAPIAKASPVYDEIVAKAEKLREADPKLSLGDAQTAVLKADRELSARYLDEQRG